MAFNKQRALRLPPGGDFHEMIMPDKTVIRAAHWPTRQKAVSGTVILLQGRREFIEKYFETIADLQARGFHVFTLDWRGQGLSTRPLANQQKGYVEDFSLYIDDLANVMNTFILPNAPTPLYLLGHSMGGHCALRYLHDYPETIDKAVLVAPMVDIEMGGMATVSRVIVRAAVMMGLSRKYAVSQGDYSSDQRGKEADLLSSSKERLGIEIEHCRRNPALALGGVTYGWLEAAFRSARILHAAGYAEAIKTPTLIITAGMDKVVSNSSHTIMAQRLQSGIQHTVEKARHELLMEKDDYRDRFWVLFDKFTGSRL